MKYTPNNQTLNTLSLLLLGGLAMVICSCQGENGQQVQAAFRQTTSGETIQTPPRTARSVEENRTRDPLAPRARAQVYPDNGHATLTNFRFDAALSTDDVNTGRQLSKRWDFDGDGIWDMDYSKRNRVYYTYADTGRFSPRLQVRDLSGRVDSCRVETLHIRGDCPAPDFSMVDINPNSQSCGEPFTLSEQKGHRVLVWYLMPSK
jgi:PKD domain